MSQIDLLGDWDHRSTTFKLAYYIMMMAFFFFLMVAFVPFFFLFSILNSHPPFQNQRRQVRSVLPLLWVPQNGTVRNSIIYLLGISRKLRVQHYVFIFPTKKFRSSTSSTTLIFILYSPRVLFIHFSPLD